MGIRSSSDHSPGPGENDSPDPPSPNGRSRVEIKIRLPDGTRKSVYGRTRAEAEAKARRARLELSRGEALPPDRLTVNQLLDRWLTEIVKPTKSPRTYRSYKQYVRLYIADALGSYRVARLDASAVQRMLNGMHDRGLARRTIEYTRAILRAALNQGRRWGLVGQNPATLVVLPRGTRQPKETPEFGAADARAVLAAIKDHRLGPMLTTMLYLGLRPAEVRALAWSDIDRAARTVQIRRGNV